MTFPKIGAILLTSWPDASKPSMTLGNCAAFAAAEKDGLAGLGAAHFRNMSIKI